MTPKELRQQFKKETGVAPVFAKRVPYINYIEWLESKLDTPKPEDWELLICDNCIQSTNHLNGVCLKCKPVQDRRYTSHTEKLTVDEVMARYGNLLSKDEIEQLENVAQKPEGIKTAERVRDYVAIEYGYLNWQIMLTELITEGKHGTLESIENEVITIYATQIGEAVKQMCADKVEIKYEIGMIPEIGEKVSMPYIDRDSILSININELIK